MSCSRRQILIGASSGLAATSCSSVGLKPHTKQTNHNELFDLSDPDDNLTALVKVTGDLNGSAVWHSAQGRIHALRKGEMPLPILAVEGVRRIRFEKISSGYTMHSRDWAIFRDIETGEVLKEFRNPITGKTNKVSPILIPPTQWDMTPNKGQQMPDYTGEAYLIDRPLLLPWVKEGDQMTMLLELLVKYSSGTAGGEWEHFNFSANDLNNPSLTSVPTTQNWTGHSPWLRWMDMGSSEGRTLWQSSGMKHAQYESLRPEFIEAINMFYAGSLEAPETYIKP
ncbi:DUF1838 family protein [Hirschia maritima]|uniref:DUF1838 family protein n=1 Tax=Hirschia maritima TaxID=1121961 RepID=UPI0003617660|nr:DUF1838 family protein [Hirschia maritima]